MEFVWVGLGGFLGANARYGLGRLIVDRFGTAFPWGTLIVNVSGSLAIGVLLTLLLDRLAPDRWRLLAVIGFLGGYTTFSSYAFEAITLTDRGQLVRAGAYVVASNLAALAACALGIAVARSLGR